MPSTGCGRPILPRCSEPKGDAVIHSRDLLHSCGDGNLRTKILHGLDFEVLAGPDTLVGALHSLESGELDRLGTPLRGASERKRIALLRRIGFNFQCHTLVSSQTVLQSVQRVAVDRALAPEPELELADEPTTGLEWP